MPSLVPIGAEAVERLCKKAFDLPGCVECGAVVLRGATSWEAHERGWIELPTHAGTLRVGIGYDEREAPFALGADGLEDRRLLLSLTDEDDCIACAWARMTGDAPLRGVGIDLSAASHFNERASGRDLARLLLTERERELAWSIGVDDPRLAYATLFAAKEAAFKATAAPLRRWYEGHSDQLRFEVRHFVMEELGVERGSGRDGAAQAAMDAMGIAQVRLHWAQVDDMALVVAVALGDSPA